MRVLRILGIVALLAALGLGLSELLLPKFQVSAPLPALEHWARQLTGAVPGLDTAPTWLANAFRQFPLWAVLGLVGSLLVLIGWRRKTSTATTFRTLRRQVARLLGLASLFAALGLGLSELLPPEFQVSTPLPELAHWARPLTGVIPSLDHVPTWLADAFRQFPLWAVLGLVGALLLLIGRRRKTPAAAPALPSEAARAPVSGTSAAHAQADAKAEFGAVLRSFKGAFMGLALFSGISNILMLTGSMFMLEIYDRVLPSRSVPTLVGLAILAGILFLGQGVLDFVRGRILSNVGAALDEAVSGRIYTTIVRLPLFDRQPRRRSAAAARSRQRSRLSSRALAWSPCSTCPGCRSIWS